MAAILYMALSLAILTGNSSGNKSTESSIEYVEGSGAGDEAVSQTTEVTPILPSNTTGNKSSEFAIEYIEGSGGPESMIDNNEGSEERIVASPAVSGLTQVKAYIKEKSWFGRGGGTNDEVAIELYGGQNNSTCRTGWLDEKQGKQGWVGWGPWDNWSSKDTETYTTNFANCTTFQPDGKDFRFKMIVSNEWRGFGKLKGIFNHAFDVADKLCLNKMEFTFQAETYVWNATKEYCWEDTKGPINIATKII